MPVEADPHDGVDGLFHAVAHRVGEVVLHVLPHLSAVGAALDGAPDGADRLVVAGDAYIAWALEHPGAYQLLFESDDELPATRAEHGPRLQRRIVELAHRVDPQAPFAAALLLWSAWHGVVSLRLHKTWCHPLRCCDADTQGPLRAHGASPVSRRHRPATPGTLPNSNFTAAFDAVSAGNGTAVIRAGNREQLFTERLGIHFDAGRHPYPDAAHPADDELGPPLGRWARIAGRPVDRAGQLGRQLIG
ncbi:WHG domain-containing protein [Streptomyces albiflaviniger]|nr:WHG domain-containing protein [Streptomyces albiflaviniger]